MSDFTAQQAVTAIEEYRKKRGGQRSEWYAGIAKSPRDRLFSDHNVDEKNGNWKYVRCSTDDAARAAEKALLEAGYQGGDGGGSSDTKYVYAYRITKDTVE